MLSRRSIVLPVMLCLFASAVGNAAEKRDPRSPKNSGATPIRSAPVANMTLDYSDQAGFGLTITSRAQGNVSVDFGWDADRNAWRPLFPPDATATTVGPDLESWVERTAAQREIHLEPHTIDPSILLVPHDDVTLHLLPEQDLVIISVWRGGDVVGIYYSFRPSDELLQRFRERIHADPANQDGGEVADGIFPTLCYFIDCFCFTGSRVACLFSTIMGCNHSCLP